MSAIIERAKAHFQAKLAGEMSFIDVPEWGENDQPLRVYWKPISMAARNKIFKFWNDGSLEALVETLIQRARNEDESKMFVQANRTELMRSVDPDVISRVVNAMQGDDQEVEDNLKKS